MYGRVQDGVAEGSGLWVSNHRCDDADASGSARSSALSERFIRNQYQAWRDYMGAPDGR